MFRSGLDLFSSDALSILILQTVNLPNNKCHTLSGECFQFTLIGSKRKSGSSFSAWTVDGARPVFRVHGEHCLLIVTDLVGEYQIVATSCLLPSLLMNVCLVNQECIYGVLFQQKYTSPCYYYSLQRIELPSVFLCRLECTRIYYIDGCEGSKRGFSEKCQLSRWKDSHSPGKECLRLRLYFVIVVLIKLHVATIVLIEVTDENWTHMQCL